MRKVSSHVSIFNLKMVKILVHINIIVLIIKSTILYYRENKNLKYMSQKPVLHTVNIAQIY